MSSTHSSPRLLSLLILATTLGMAACAASPTLPITPVPTVLPTLAPAPTPTPTPLPLPRNPATYLATWTPAPPNCLSPNPAIPVCQISLPGQGSFAVSPTTKILFRLGWTDAMASSCAAYTHNTTLTFTLDAKPLAFSVLPCQLLAYNPFPYGQNSNQWDTDARLLSGPLAIGPHTAIATLTYQAAVPYWTGCTATPPPCYIPPATVSTFQVVINVA